MLPLLDNVPASRFPVITFSLIVLNVLAFFYELKLGPDTEYFLMDYGIVPARYTNHAVSQHFSLIEQIVPFLSSMFSPRWLGASVGQHVGPLDFRRQRRGSPRTR